MISASTLSCYSALSSHMTTNHFITFLTLHSRYPVLQPINTYYSLIRAVYVFRACALFCPCITSPLLYRDYPHVFSISRNCLASPHCPESLHRAFIPRCIYIPHCAVYLSCFLFPVPTSVLPVSKYSCPCPVSLGFVFYLCLLVCSVLS